MTPPKYLNLPLDEIEVHSVHLPCNPYAPYLIADGASQKTIENSEKNAQFWAVKPVMDSLMQSVRFRKKVLKKRVLGVLLGDFNAPSHLDYEGKFQFAHSRYAMEKGLVDVHHRMFQEGC